MSLYSNIGEIVDNMRVQSDIVSITDNADNTYTVQVKVISNSYFSGFSLSDNDYITISDTAGFSDDDGNYRVSNVDLNARTFDISKTSGQAITTLGTYKANAPYYDFEKWLGESNKLTTQSLSKIFANQRFPLIFLLLDVSQNITQSGYSEPTNLTLFFIEKTRPDKRANWRLENKFNPTLSPLQELFIAKLNSYSKSIITDAFNYQVTDRFFLGTEDANQNKLNQYVEAIQLNINNYIFKKAKLLNCNVKNLL